MRLVNEYGQARLIVENGSLKLAESCLSHSGLVYSKIEYGFELKGRLVQDFAISLLQKLASYTVRGHKVRAKLLLSF